MPSLDFDKIVNVFGNSILFYKDHLGNLVFRNYCILDNNGCSYKLDLKKQEVGSILEYRLEMDKHIRKLSIFIILIFYFIFIHMPFNFGSFLFCEICALILISLLKIRAAYLYSRHLTQNLGKYQLVEFHPPHEDEKFESAKINLISKIAVTAIIIILCFLPAILLSQFTKIALNSNNPHIKIGSFFSKTYSLFYPKTPKFYDMRAYIKYNQQDYKGAKSDYIHVLKSKKLNKNDFVRLGNLMFLEKELSSAQNALDLFNDFATRKTGTILEESQLLWIKSIFSIENHMYDTIIQDYDDFLNSLKKTDTVNRFYINSDKAYMLYLMNEYIQSLNVYNEIIEFAQNNEKRFKKDLKNLYAERAFARLKIGDRLGAQTDFDASGIPADEINSYEPSYRVLDFVKDKF